MTLRSNERVSGQWRSVYNLSMPCRNLSHAQAGLTLTESITALLVLGIGVLCIATVYLERSQAAPAVLLHSKASRLAAEMTEHMNAYRNDGVHFDNPVGVRCQETLTSTDKQQQATNDLACWQDKVARTLPNGSGAIARDPDRVRRAYLVTVSWSAPEGGTASYLQRWELPPSRSGDTKPLPLAATHKDAPTP
jgi:type IV pilus assembly protein PilV